MIICKQAFTRRYSSGSTASTLWRIANGVDSDDQNSNEFAPFLNIMNEWYLRDLSRKQKTAIRVKGESGKPTTNCAIYGYKKDPENKYHWLIDEEAAAVVRRIFRLTIEAKDPTILPVFSLRIRWRRCCVLR